MKSLKLFGLVASMLLFLNVRAQEVTDYDLQNFARAYRETVQLNLKAQNEMAGEIQKAGLDLDTYHAIHESKQPGAEYEPELPDSDFDKYEKVQPKIVKIQSQLEADVLATYKKHDLTKKKYAAISERVKQDYILQAKLEKILAAMR